MGRGWGGGGGGGGGGVGDGVEDELCINSDTIHFSSCTEVK